MKDETVMGSQLHTPGEPDKTEGKDSEGPYQRDRLQRNSLMKDGVLNKDIDSGMNFSASNHRNSFEHDNSY